MAESKKPFDFRSLAPKPKKPDFSPADFELDADRRVLPAPQPPATAPETKLAEKPTAAKPPKKTKDAKPAAKTGEAGDVGPKVVIMGLSSGSAGGRPTFKGPNTECVKLVLQLPLETKRLMQKALAEQFFGKYRTNVQLVDAAIRAFIANGGK